MEGNDVNRTNVLGRTAMLCYRRQSLIDAVCPGPTPVSCSEERLVVWGTRYGPSGTGDQEKS